MRGEQQEMNASRGRPPASGERAALAGYVPQYEVAAGLLLRSLTEESLEWLAVLDPEAGRLDDFQLATPGYLDAFQVKWSQAGGQLAWGELRAYLVDLVVDRRRLARQHTDRRVIGHLYSDRVASSSRTVSASSGRRDATIADAVMHLLQPATTGAFASLEEMPDAWGWLWRDLAGRCGLSERELLGDFALVRIELGRTLPSLAEVPAATRFPTGGTLMSCCWRCCGWPRIPGSWSACPRMSCWIAWVRPGGNAWSCARHTSSRHPPPTSLFTPPPRGWPRRCSGSPRATWRWWAAPARASRRCLPRSYAAARTWSRATTPTCVDARMSARCARRPAPSCTTWC